MKQIDIERVVHGMLHVARPLEISRVRHLLSDGTKQEVIEELKKYQNEDGGFGHGLEPDAWNPHSSGIQTWAACNIIREHAIDQMDPMVEKLIDYLSESFDDTIQRWHSIHPDHKDYPHAPWWEHEGDLKSFNPSASLAGFIIKYGNPMLPIYKKAKSLIEEALDFILNTKDQIERHELRCFVEMINDITDLYQHQPKFQKAKRFMILHMDEVIEKDRLLWFKDYVNKPSSLIKHHPSLGSEVFFDLLCEEIDEAFDHQNEEHLWDITWQWNAYPEAFSSAKNHWQGIIAFEYLKLIKDLGILIE
ncbi:MAG: hypothetical protein A2Y45_01075 [Tenericutes bacterium GWC2_34_14]|nr:MAG: hypothetical protein A2Y45_01075 [Tenericutes bacterium GWC2_34_14]OHE34585.1 MAG: hypothetical protein A2012_08695 [Tenericutes bacterium GWE2_34_108]OHE35942.1 MAG: hypothetical protein A2Y46_03400 [Tenericutes bacterium GWF1_35_14]OHE38972.1 MAG: hypothetical protein A2Y44_06530 [Tenericutes bacterium GWF2_35_184]OHE42288.1 MAG: hypothetical protein A3K26_00570 [Tenericutes bacterium RIFOXYA12_FULL_35_10]OHE42961.1 MAG: hypothetical protein A2221_09705 [Tenericutes bacterium RIFOXYA